MFSFFKRKSKDDGDKKEKSKDKSSFSPFSKRHDANKKEAIPSSSTQLHSLSDSSLTVAAIDIHTLKGVTEENTPELSTSTTDTNAQYTFNIPPDPRDSYQTKPDTLTVDNSLLSKDEQQYPLTSCDLPNISDSPRASPVISEEDFSRNEDPVVSDGSERAGSSDRADSESAFKTAPNTPVLAKHLTIVSDEVAIDGLNQPSTVLSKDIETKAKNPLGAELDLPSADCDNSEEEIDSTKAQPGPSSATVETVIESKDCVLEEPQKSELKKEQEMCEEMNHGPGELYDIAEEETSEEEEDQSEEEEEEEEEDDDDDDSGNVTQPTIEDEYPDEIIKMESIPSTPQPTLSHELRALISQRNILTAKSKSKVLNALDKQIEEGKKKQQLDLRNKVIEEIFTSEVSYLSQLEIIMKFFKEPLESSNLVAASTKRTLFGNIESIYQVNGELVNQLKMQGNNVAAAFLYLAPFFKIYSMYAYNYKSAINLLEDLRTHNSSLAAWIRNQESRPEVGNKLAALLIAPIQRLPRYRLLLRQLLSLTLECHPHRSTLVEAVKEVEKATSHINNLVFEQETHSRLVTLQNCLLHSKPCIEGPNKKLIKEGILMKMSANGQKAQKRYFILLSDSVVYCKLLSKEEELPGEHGSLQCCCVLPISKCSVENVLGQGVFNLSCRNETYILFSEHRDDVMEWITAIRSAISQYHDNMKTLRKKSSSRHTLHLTRKRKFLKENNHPQNEESPLKKMKTSLPPGQGEERENEHCEGIETPYLCQENTQKNNYLQSIKSLLTTFGESVRRYMFPGTSAR